MHTMRCVPCFLSLPSYFRSQVEHDAIDAAILRQAMMGDEMGAIRWTEQQYQDHMHRRQKPASQEDRKVKGCPAITIPAGVLAFTLPLTLAPSRNALDRMHFRTKRRLLGEVANTYREQLQKQKFELPLGKVKIEVIRYSSTEPDPDGMMGFVKPLLDAMQVKSDRHPYGVGVIVNDDSSHVQLSTRWVKANPNKGKVVILVTPL